MHEAALYVAVFAALYILWRYTKPTHHPPGPFRWPIVGNAFDIPTETPWRQFAEWGKQYGDIVYLRVFGRSILVLNSLEAITDLYEQRSSIYSDKSPRAMGELSGFGRILATRLNGDDVRETRKLLNTEFGPRAIKRHTHILEENARRLCLSNIEHPEEFLGNIHRMSVANIMRIAYGYVVGEDVEADELVVLATQVMHDVSTALAANTYLVNSLPFLRYIPAFVPGASFQKTAARSRETFDLFLRKPFEFVLNQVNSGTAMPSLLSNALEENGLENSMSNATYLNRLKDAGAEVYGAGTDTNASIISSFYLAMVLYPDVQRRAQEEIVAVIGDERLPRLSDRESLPYVGALVEEIFRWNTPAPAVTRAILVPDVYRDFHIPAGTVVVANLWAVTRNESWFPDPETFNPERYLNRDKEPQIPEPTSLIFGFGRRSCPGSYLAVDTVWTAVAMTLATCTISPELDAEGKAVLPEVRYTSGAFSHPYPFCCQIHRRSEGVSELLDPQ
ncbi:cytochrome P450 [Desarmillaria tabescens]|uniref:Cytochrome P450 n=1 Tax=Armillaria tabescens TaxID=1929756 RepID=A0AA39N521_ARMTA|nr:cytochrome P450 [Desarmillaria tabescens]KAK0458177.1 cytochrome P450 [Desarmillaria tabescens]